MSKQRKESVEQFKAGNRQDLADKEAAEIALLQGYMPSQLSAAELDALINDAVAATGAASIKDMGKVMALIKTKAQGRADMAASGRRSKPNWADNLRACPRIPRVGAVHDRPNS